MRNYLFDNWEGYLHCGVWCSFHNTYDTLLGLCIRCTYHLCYSFRFYIVYFITAIHSKKFYAIFCLFLASMHQGRVRRPRSIRLFNGPRLVGLIPRQANSQRPKQHKLDCEAVQRSMHACRYMESHLGYCSSYWKKNSISGIHLPISGIRLPDIGMHGLIFWYRGLCFPISGNNSQYREIRPIFRYRELISRYRESISRYWVISQYWEINRIADVGNDREISGVKPPHLPFTTSLGGTARWLQLQPSSAWPRRRKRSKMFSLCTTRITARPSWDSSGF